MPVTKYIDSEYTISIYCALHLIEFLCYLWGEQHRGLGLGLRVRVMVGVRGLAYERVGGVLRNTFVQLFRHACVRVYALMA